MVAQITASNLKSEEYTTLALQQIEEVNIIDTKKALADKISNQESKVSTTSIARYGKPKIISSPESFNTDLFSKGFFYGISVMVIIINIICLFIFSDKVYGYFAFLVATITTLIFTTDGLISVFFKSIALHSTRIETTLLVLGTISASLFSSKFLNSKEVYPRLRSITIPLLYLAGMLTVLFWFIDNPTFMTAASIISFVIILSYFTVGIKLFKTKNYAKFYIVGFIIPLFFNIDYFLLGGMGFNFFGTEANHIKISVVIQMLLLTYAIVYRMQEIKDESILRHIEMKIFLERQDAMSRDNLAQMMRDVYLENLIMQYDLDGIEIKLLQYISEDKSNEKIAKKLSITPNEVEEITKDLYNKLEISEAIKEDHRMLEAQPDYLYN
ncbi:hypothetical protein ULMS_15640 [Patiriisocius marinistellae]|uniref:7TM-DISM receptor extracellular domain-containing protein n=2 Tax=Patiriisocius marinistellae TaxID=2494560 RepID=A0A5J4G0T3_9FLAO|nr:hypothetical protein ULMS_15640 [Patiriisocius marinistellae]